MGQTERTGTRNKNTERGWEHTQGTGEGTGNEREKREGRGQNTQ